MVSISKLQKLFREELDGVVHPSAEYSSSNDHHQPHFTQAGDLEQSIRDMFKEYKFQKYNPKDHEFDLLNAEGSWYRMNAYHEFDGWFSYDLFSFKLLTFYTFLYRLFKLEYFLCKSSSKPLDILHLERYVFNGSDYWKMTEKADLEEADNIEQANFEIYSDSEDARAEENKVSKEIIKQIVTQKRRRVKLQDDMENLYESMLRIK